MKAQMYYICLILSALNTQSTVLHYEDVNLIVNREARFRVSRLHYGGVNYNTIITIHPLR